MGTKKGIADLLDAVMFAAERHRNQRRKDADASPYINHPIALAHMLSSVGGVDDIEVLQAAVLHDTIEDTETSESALRERFGAAVANIVLEVTDDKSLPKERRKELQVERAPYKSRAAALIKLADKTCNLKDIAHTPPADWSLARKQAYFDLAKRVVDALPLVNEAMLDAFSEAYANRPTEPSSSSLPDRDGCWLSMPGPLKGMSGFVRVVDSGDIEVELYDHSERAQSSFGSDVSTIYTVSKADLPELANRLAVGFGGDVPKISDLPERLTTFLDVQALIDWLAKDAGLTLAKRVDFEV